MELRQCLHDDADERQVKHGNTGLDFRIGVARIRVVAGQQVVNDAHYFLMQTKHPTVDKTQGIKKLIISPLTRIHRFFLNENIFTNMLTPHSLGPVLQTVQTVRVQLDNAVL